MEYIVELFNHFFYFWLGKKIFGDNFVENRKNTLLWKRFLVGCISFLLIGLLVFGGFILFKNLAEKF